MFAPQVLPVRKLACRGLLRARQLCDEGIVPIFKAAPAVIAVAWGERGGKPGREPRGWLGWRWHVHWVCDPAAVGVHTRLRWWGIGRGVNSEGQDCPFAAVRVGVRDGVRDGVQADV